MEYQEYYFFTFLYLIALCYPGCSNGYCKYDTNTGETLCICDEGWTGSGCEQGDCYNKRAEYIFVMCSFSYCSSCSLQGFL